MPGYSTRNLTLSLEYRFYQIMVQAGWTLSVTGVPLVAVKGAGVPANTYAAKDITMPWCFFDGDQKNTNRVGIRIYAGTRIVDQANYTLNFRDGQVSFKTMPTGTLTADLSYFVARVREGYPEEEELTNADLPIVAFNVEGQQASPFAVGSAADLLTYPLEVTLFCTDDGQRKDLADDILEGLKAVPLLDMADTPFLTDTGDANLDFNCARQRLGFANVFNRLSRLLHPRVGGLDKERYRALVTANIKNVS